MSFSKDVVPIEALRNDCDAAIQRAQKTKQPIVVMQSGEAAVVIVDAAQYEKEMQERDTYLAVGRGLSSMRTYTAEEIENELDALLRR
jgi:prevent-host-death family protein